MKKISFLGRLLVLSSGFLLFCTNNVSAWSTLTQRRFLPRQEWFAFIHHGKASFRRLSVSGSSDYQKETNTEKSKIDDGVDEEYRSDRGRPSYDLGVGKNPPVRSMTGVNSFESERSTEPVALESLMGNDVSYNLIWNKTNLTAGSCSPGNNILNKRQKGNVRRVRRMVPRNQESSTLRGAIWHEEHYANNNDREESDYRKTYYKGGSTFSLQSSSGLSDDPFPRPVQNYPDIDLSIPLSVYDPMNGIDVVWDVMRWEAYQEAQREPLLVSFLYSSILNHDTLESSLSFLLANKLSGTMIATQVNSLIIAALNNDPSIGRAVRADIMAVRDRDPACTCLPDVFLYFKGFHALQTYRVANAIWRADKQVLAHYLQSQMSATFQIDIHPNATLGSGIMLDHGTGIVIGETASVGHNVSILHHVTLGGSGKKGVDRHPKVSDGVLIGAGASILGNVKIGEGVQIGAGGLVITDLPPHVVAVGVPVKIIGRFVDVTEQPSIGMNQMMDQRIKNIDAFLTDGI